MKCVFLIFLISGIAFGSTKRDGVKLGIYVTDDEGFKCAYLVSKNLEESVGVQPGVSVTFIHDPRYLPKTDCRSNGFSHYPIGIEIVNHKTFYDLRAEAGYRRLYKYYSFTNLSHEDL